MSRIPLAQVDEMSPAQREQYDRFPSNLSRALLLADDRLAGVPPVSANALRASALDEQVREAVILRVAQLCGCPYERMQHLLQARNAGFDDDDIAAIERGDTTKQSDVLKTAIAFTNEAVTLVKVTRPTFERATAIFSSRDIVTMLLLIGHYMMVARLLETLEVELDPAPDTFTTEH